MTDTCVDLYPEHAKQAMVLRESQAIGQFLDEGSHVLAEYREVEGYRDPHLVPVARSIEQVLADWFGIDLDAIEREKRAMLAAMRELNAGHEEQDGPT